MIKIILTLFKPKHETMAECLGLKRYVNCPMAVIRNKREDRAHAE